MKTLLTISFIILMTLSGNSQDDLKAHERPPIIDMHMHTGLPHEVPAGTPALCRPEPCKGNGQATIDPDELFEKTL